MIHYNPELHQDKVLLHIAHSILTGLELDTPYQPMRNDGSASDVILMTEHETYLIDPHVFFRLKLDAFTYAYHRAKSIISGYENLKSFFNQNPTIGQDAVERHLRLLHQTDRCPRNIPTDGNPLYEEDPETSRKEAIRRAFEPTFGMTQTTAKHKTCNKKCTSSGKIVPSTIDAHEEGITMKIDYSSKSPG